VRIGLTNSSRIEKRAWQLFETRFLRKGESPAVQREVESQLLEKLERGGKLQRGGGKLRRVVAEASQLWASRSRLRKTDVAYLAAALLYFISPLDAVPDVLPGIGYVDDVLIVTAIVGLVTRGMSALGTRGKARLEEWIDERTERVCDRLDESATSGVQRAVAAVVISLWGTTTAAAISLSVAMILGRYPVEWLTYVLISSAFVLMCNISTAVYFCRAYRQLDGQWQARLRTLVASKLRLPQLIAIGLPIFVLIALAVIRFVTAA
jgi:uncharacterized membrane protein YkvA (DUF1232 family)